jgi:hypothetical protein
MQKGLSRFHAGKQIADALDRLWNINSRLAACLEMGSCNQASGRLTKRTRGIQAQWRASGCRLTVRQFVGPKPDWNDW